jgi:hypothetical protein
MLTSHALSAILGPVTFCVGCWHAYGHVGTCRWVLNIRGKKGAGLMTGESLEHLWPLLIKYAGFAKRMRPAIFTDCYAHAIFNINARSVCKSIYYCC